MESVADGANDSYAAAPGINANRCGDMLDLLVGLMDSGTLTITGVHAAADATNPVAAADPTDLAECQTLLNELQTDANAHFVIVGASEHIGADVTNSIDAAAATDQATSETLANEAKADINAHMLLAAATGHYVADTANVITAADASDLPTLIALCIQLKAVYNAHIGNVNGASPTLIADNAAITGANSLVNCTVTFASATTTVALRDVTRTIMLNTVDTMTLSEALPATPVTGDTFTLSYSAVDTDIAQLRGSGRGLGDSQSNVHGPGPSFVNAVMKVLQNLGASVPSYLNAASAEPSGLGSPHAGHGGTHGHAALHLASDMLDRVRDAVAAHTVTA